MFMPTGLSAEIFKNRYAFTETETWPEACARVARQMSLAETPDKQAVYNDKFYEVLVSNQFVPGGRIWYNSGRHNPQLLNCFSGDTRFVTKTGIVSFKDAVGLAVEVLNKDATWENATVQAFGRQRIYNLHLSNGEVVRTTAGHEWIQRDGSRKTTLEIDEVLFAQPTPIEPSIEGIRHGIVFGDGHIDTTGFGQVVLCGEKKQELTRFFDNTPRESIGFNGSVRTYYPITDCSTGKVIHRQPASYKELPSSDCSPEYARGFIAGLLATDGCVPEKGSVILSCEGYALGQRIAELAVLGGCVVTSTKVTSRISPFNGAERELTTILIKPFSAPAIRSDQVERLSARNLRRNFRMSVDVEAVVDTGVDETVYCVVAPQTHSFTLANGVLTGNCFVLTNELDSKEGWGDISREMIITSMTGGGCGIDFSDVRPRGAPITSQRGECPGPVALMELLDLNAKPVRAGGQRRVALMFSLDLDHPDVLEFLDAKLTRGKLTHANVSVRSKRTNEFIHAVRTDGEWELSWKGKFKKSIRAKELWDKIVKNAYESAEPGFLNWELVEDESNIGYIEKLATTNPCVTGDTEILTRDGHKRIDTLLGTEVEIWNGFEWSKVTPEITGKNQAMVKVTLSSGQSLTCTEYHGFQIARGYTGESDKVVAKDLQPGMKLIKHALPVIEHGPELEAAYLQGFYSAEGMDGYNFIYVYDPKAVCLDERLRGFGGRIKPEPEYGRTKFTFEQTLQPKSFVPHSHNLKSKLDWLSGLFDGDGCELKEGGLQLWSVDKQFLLEVQKLLSTVSTFSKVLEGKPEQVKAMPGGEYNCQECFRICISASAMHKLASYGLSCVRLKFDKTPNRDASQFVQIISVEAAPVAETVYCFNEPKRHLGIFNGILTAQCGEIALSPYDCCCLGHLVLPRFIKDGKFDWAGLALAVRIGVRFLDNVLTVNNYPLPEMREKSHKLRRIGLGTTGLADVLAILGMKYGGESGNEFSDKLYRFISKVAYEASIMLAVEKGAFPACDPIKHLESGFMKRMPAKIRALVAEHGIRNCALLTQAPTGTVSILSGNVSSGIEPMFAPAYERRYWKDEKRETALVFHPLFEQFMKEGKDVAHFVGARDLNVRAHMEVQRIVQKHADNAVSKTINVPEEYSLEDMSANWLDYLPTLKGTTFYRENTRGYVDEAGVVHEPPLKAISLEEAVARFKEQHTVEATLAEDCPSGICSI